MAESDLKAALAKADQAERELRNLRLTVTRAEQETAQAQSTLQARETQLTERDTELATLRTQIQTLNTQSDNTNSTLAAPSLFSHTKELHSSLQRLKPFSGGYSPTFSDWLTRYEELCMASQWKDDRRAEILPLYLEDVALETYRRLSDDTKKVYATLKTELTKQLQPVESPRFCANLLYAPRKQGDTEKVGAYGAEIQRLTRGAHPISDTFPAPAQDNIMRDVFISGLKGTDRTGVKAHVLERDAKTFQEALEIALKAEAQDWLLEGTNPISSLKPQTANANQPEIHAIQSLNTNRRFNNQNNANRLINRTPTNRNFHAWLPNQNAWRPNQNNYNTNFRPKHCTYCSRQGHTYQECRTRQREQNPSSKQCNYCTRIGHTWKECRTRQREQGQTPQTRFSSNQFTGHNQQFSNRPNKVASNVNNARSRGMQNQRPYQNAALQTQTSAVQNDSPNETETTRACNEMLTTFRQGMQQIITDAKSAFSNKHDSTNEYSLYAINSPTESSVHCGALHSVGDCSHTDEQWDSISDQCKQYLVCENKHHMFLDNRWTNCIDGKCTAEPINVVCGVCWHESKCTICKSNLQHVTPQAAASTQAADSTTSLTNQTTTQPVINEASETNTQMSSLDSVFQNLHMSDSDSDTDKSEPDTNCTHTNLDWWNIDWECVKSLTCAAGHPMHDDIQHNTKCVDTTCILPEVCGVCLHNNSCTFCNAASEQTNVSIEANLKLHSTNSNAHISTLTLTDHKTISPIRLNIQHLQRVPTNFHCMKNYLLPAITIFAILVLSFGFGAADLSNWNIPLPTQREYFICGKSRSGYALSLPRNITCKPLEITNDSVSPIKIELWVPKTDPSHVDAWKCHFRTRTICSYTNPFVAKSILSDTTKTSPVTYTECWNAVKNHTYNGTQFIKHSSGVFTTGHVLIVTYPYCCYTKCHTVTNFILEKGQVASVDGYFLSSDLGDMGSCMGDWQHECKTDNAIIVWDRMQLRKICSMERKGIYHAVKNDHHIIVDELQSAFSQTPIVTGYEHRPKRPGCLPQYVQFMDQNVGIATLSHRDEPDWWQDTNIDTLQESGSSQPSNFTADPVNAKLEYLMYKFRYIEQKHFRNIWLELCRLSQQVLQHTWQLLRIDATLGIRAFLGREDIHATFAGEVLMIWQCRRVYPNKFYWDYKINNTCYAFVPVDLQGEYWFIVPGTTDLVNTAPEIPCEHHTKGIFKINEQFRSQGASEYRSTTGYIHVVEVPVELSWKNLWTPFTFNAPAVFHDKVSGLMSSLSMLSSYVHHTHKLDRKLAGLVNYTAELSLDPSIIRNAIEGLGEGVGNLFSSAATGLEHVIHDIGHTTGDLLSSILKGPLQGILNFLFILILIFAFFYLGYYLFRTQIWPKMKHTNVIKRVRRTSPQAWYQRFKRRISGTRDPPPQSQRNTDEIEMHEQQQFSEPASSQTTEITAEVHSKNEWPIPTIHSVKNETVHRPTVNLSINNMTYSALVDSGSGLTLIGETTLKKLRSNSNAEIEIMPHKSDITATVVTGDAVTIQGTVDLTFQLGTHTYTHTFHLLPSLNCEQHFILGVDFLHHYGPYGFDPQKSTFHFHNDIIPLLAPPKSKHYPIHLLNTVCIPPRSAHLTQAHLKNCPALDNLMLEGSNKLPAGLQLPYQFVSPKHCITPLCLINSTEAPITIRRNKSLGYASFAEQTSLFETPQMDKNTVKAHFNNVASVHTQCTRPIDQLAMDIDQRIILSQSVLTPTQTQSLKQCLEANIDRFATTDFDLGHTELLQHEIDTGGSPPIHQKPYPVPFSQRSIIEEHVNKMLKQGVIQPSNSPWSSPVVLVKKKDNTIRFCIDYRKLNAITVKDTYPLPRIDEILLTLGQSQYYTSLDLMSGYWQVGVKKEDRPKTAFITFGGLWEFISLPFGLCNAPSLFQRLMERVLAGLLWRFCFCYIDDILICSPTFEDHIEHLNQVFARLRKHGLKLKLKKCHFALKEIQFLGHTVSPKGIAVDPTKTDRVQKFPQPTTVTELKAFLGLASYYRRFVPNFAQVSAPLNALLRKNAPFQWTSTCDIAFCTLKRLLTQPPILVFPDFTQPFLLQTDASGKAIAGILAQKHNGIEHPIAYASRTLTPAETRYPVIEQECLACVWSIKHFRQYLYGHRIILQTDHSPLKWLLKTAKSPDGSSRLHRWALALQEYDYEVQHKAGMNNANADALSRISDLPEQTSQQTTLQTSNHIASVTESSPSTMHAYQLADPKLTPLITFLQDNSLPYDNKEARHIVQISSAYTLVSGLLYHINSHRRSLLQLVIPDKLRSELLASLHSDIFAGHLGFRKTYNKITQHYYWNTMVQDIYDYCTACLHCQQRKSPSKPYRAPLVPLQAVERPWDRVAMDIMGPINPPSDLGHKYIIIFTDYLTRWVEGFSLHDIKTETIAKVFVEAIVCRFGAPRTLLSDRAPNFLSNLIHDICQIMNIHQIHTSPYHPATDGLVERFNRTIIDMLSAYVQHRTDWNTFLPFALFAYRTSVHESIKESPYFLLFGQDARIPISEVFTQAPSPYLVDVDLYQHVLRRHLHNAWLLAKNNLIAAQNRQKRYYDQKVRTHSFKEGDRVWLHNPVKTPGISPKFHLPWFGPYRVTSTSYLPVIEIILISKPDKPIRVHLNRLKPFWDMPEHLLAKLSHIDHIDPNLKTENHERQLKHPYNLRSSKIPTFK